MRVGVPSMLKCGLGCNRATSGSTLLDCRLYEGKCGKFEIGS